MLAADSLSRCRADRVCVMSLAWPYRLRQSHSLVAMYYWGNRIYSCVWRRPLPDPTDVTHGEGNLHSFCILVRLPRPLMDWVWPPNQPPLYIGSQLWATMQSVVDFGWLCLVRTICFQMDEVRRPPWGVVGKVSTFFFLFPWGRGLFLSRPTN
jgi:hypothetical protein